MDMILEIKGKEIEDVLNKMDIYCILKNYFENELVEHFDYSLINIGDFKKIKKAVEIMRLCMHKNIVQVNNTEWHFAIEIKKENSVLNLVEYNKKFNNPKNNYSAFLGIDNNSEPVMFDLQKTIHTLIGGATGMGKTNIINNIIYSLTNKTSKDDLKLYIIDKKRTLSIWDKLPHLQNKPIHNASEALDLLEKVSDIMEKRIMLLEKQKKSKADTSDFPYIVVIIDELADLMLSGVKSWVEEEIEHIAQLGRAVNISLIIATQNPLVKVCTSLIKANLPTRIALKTVSARDSMNILDSKDAVDLEGIGYAIIRSAEDQVKRKFKACYLSDDEIKEYLKGV